MKELNKEQQKAFENNAYLIEQLNNAIKDEDEWSKNKRYLAMRRTQLITENINLLGINDKNDDSCVGEIKETIYNDDNDLKLIARASNAGISAFLYDQKLLIFVVEFAIGDKHRPFRKIFHYDVNKIKAKIYSTPQEKWCFNIDKNDEAAIAFSRSDQMIAFNYMSLEYDDPTYDRILIEADNCGHGNGELSDSDVNPPSIYIPFSEI